MRAQLITAFGVDQVRKSVNGQNLKTRAQAAVKRKWKAVHSAADAYRRARRALVCLGMSEDDMFFCPLQRKDLQAFKMYTAREELAAARAELGQSHQKISWLWERWDFINKSASPEMRVFFEEGTSSSDITNQVSKRNVSVSSSVVQS